MWGADANFPLSLSTHPTIFTFLAPCVQMQEECNAPRILPPTLPFCSRLRRTNSVFVFVLINTVGNGLAGPWCGCVVPGARQHRQHAGDFVYRHIQRCEEGHAKGAREKFVPLGHQAHGKRRPLARVSFQSMRRLETRTSAGGIRHERRGLEDVYR